MKFRKALWPQSDNGFLLHDRPRNDHLQDKFPTSDASTGGVGTPVAWGYL